MSWYSLKGNDVHKVNNIISGGRIMKEKSLERLAYSLNELKEQYS